MWHLALGHLLLLAFTLLFATLFLVILSGFRGNDVEAGLIVLGDLQSDLGDTFFADLFLRERCGLFRGESELAHVWW